MYHLHDHAKEDSLPPWGRKRPRARMRPTPSYKSAACRVTEVVSDAEIADAFVAFPPLGMFVTSFLVCLQLGHDLQRRMLWLAMVVLPCQGRQVPAERCVPFSSFRCCGCVLSVERDSTGKVTTVLGFRRAGTRASSRRQKSRRRRCTCWPAVLQLSRLTHPPEWVPKIEHPCLPTSVRCGSNSRSKRAISTWSVRRPLDPIPFQQCRRIALTCRGLECVAICFAVTSAARGLRASPGCPFHAERGSCGRKGVGRPAHPGFLLSGGEDVCELFARFTSGSAGFLSSFGACMVQQRPHVCSSAVLRSHTKPQLSFVFRDYLDAAAQMCRGMQKTGRARSGDLQSRGLSNNIYTSEDLPEPPLPEKPLRWEPSNRSSRQEDRAFQTTNGLYSPKGTKRRPGSPVARRFHQGEGSLASKSGIRSIDRDLPSRSAWGVVGQRTGAHSMRPAFVPSPVHILKCCLLCVLILCGFPAIVVKACVGTPSRRPGVPCKHLPSLSSHAFSIFAMRGCRRAEKLSAWLLCQIILSRSACKIYVHGTAACTLAPNSFKRWRTRAAGAVIASCL